MAYPAKYAAGRTRTGSGHRGLRSLPAGLIAALLLAVLALTGCVTVQLNATVHPDGTLSGTARYGVAKSLAGMVGGQDQLLNQLKSQGSCDFGSRQGTTKDFDDGTYVGIECTFDKVTMAEFNSGEGGPKLTKTGDEFHLSGSMNLLETLSDSGNGLLGSAGATPSGLPSGIPTDLLPSGFPTDFSTLLPSGIPTDLLPSDFPSDLNSLFPSGIPTDLLPSGIPTDLLPSGIPTDLTSGLPGLDPTSLLRTAKVSFAFTFPGKVTFSRGQVDGHKVTFKPNSAGVIDFETTASAVPAGSSGLGSTGWLVLAVVILALLAAAGLLVRRRRAGRAVPAGGYPAPGGYPYLPEQYQHYPGQQYPPQSNAPYPPQSNSPYPPYQPQPYSGPPPTQPYPQPNPYQQPDPYEQYPAQQYPAEPNPWARPAAERPAEDRDAEDRRFRPPGQNDPGSGQF
jgi:hypothetical protein